MNFELGSQMAPAAAGYRLQQPEDYVVDGAQLTCNCGTSDTHLVIKDHGYLAGFQAVGLDINTSQEHFKSTFGICRITNQNCNPDCVGRWIETAGRQSVAGGRPLLLKSMLVCKRGGVIRIVDHGQRMAFSELQKLKYQTAEYQRQYGRCPSSEDLKHLFFIVDLRLSGAADMLSSLQLGLTDRLYQLASQYPGYYKLADQYGFGSTEYMERLREFYGIVNERRQPENVTNTLVKALLEQIGCEMNENQILLQRISTEQQHWLAIEMDRLKTLL